MTALVVAIQDARAEDDSLRSTSDVVLWTAAGFQLGHQLDHFGRKDFAFPAVGLPIVFYGTHLGGRYLLDGGPLYFTVVDTIWLIGFSITHFTGVVETPDTVYDKWTATDTTISRSAALGRIAQTIIIGGAVSLGAHLSLTIVDGRKHGFTWKRRPDVGSATAALTAGPVAGGGQLLLYGRW